MLKYAIDWRLLQSLPGTRGVAGTGFSEKSAAHVWGRPPGIRRVPPARHRGYGVVPPGDYWLRVVLLADAAATMPWLFTLTDFTTRPAGSWGIWMVIAFADCPPRSDARPLAELSWMAISLGLTSLTVPVTRPAMPRSALTASGPSAGSALIVAAPVGRSTRPATEENGISAWPLIWSMVAPLNEELRCTPFAVAVKLKGSLPLSAVTLFALMTIVLMSWAATWVRNGQPSMLTDGLALSPDD